MAFLFFWYFWNVSLKVFSTAILPNETRQFRSRGASPQSVEIFWYEPRDQRVFFILESWMSELALSVSFEYLCYGSTNIINSFALSLRGSTLDVSIWRLQMSTDVYRRQMILTSNVDPLTERGKLHNHSFRFGEKNDTDAVNLNQIYHKK